MLAGNASAAMLCQQTPDTEASYLPSDLDGPTPPVDGTPGLFISWYNNDPGQLYLRKLTLNFSAGTATLSAPTVISVANNNLACGGGTLSQRREPRRNWTRWGIVSCTALRSGTSPTMIVPSSITPSTSGSTVGIRWYELYDPAGSVTLNQRAPSRPTQTTAGWRASPGPDGRHRPRIQRVERQYLSRHSFTGRVPTDTPGTMESETGRPGRRHRRAGQRLSRWGDYTAMQVDPSDDCTFWYVDQYQAGLRQLRLVTNISSFIFNGCSTAPNFTLSSNPSSLQIQQGTSGTSTITLVPVNGFVGEPTLSAKTSPSGLTSVGFSTNPITSTSTLTVTAGANTPTGVYFVTVVGTTGILTNENIVPVTVTGAPAVSLSATALTWGNEVVGGTAAGKSFTISNVGAGTLNISSIVPSGDFAIGSTTCGGTLAVNKSCTVKLTFTPTQLGIRAGAITITDNAANSPQSVSLSGTGTVQAMLSPPTPPGQPSRSARTAPPRCSRCLTSRA